MIVWSEGLLLSTMPQGLACLILGIILLTQCQGLAMASGVLLSVLFVAFFLTETGVMWDERRQRVRSYTGWKVAGFQVYRGAWKSAPKNVDWTLKRTRKSLMNWRGAAGAITLDSTELTFMTGLERGERIIVAVHDFSDRNLAERCIRERQKYANR